MAAAKTEGVKLTSIRYPGEDLGIWTVLRGLFVIVSLLLLLGGLTNGSGGGVFISLLMLVLLLPYANLKLKEKMGFGITRGLKAVLLIILLAIAAQTVGTKEIGATTKDTGGSPQTPTQTKASEKIYVMNEGVPIDYLTYRVTKAETFTEMGTSSLNKKTNGKFVKVYLDITNNAKETKQIFTPRFKLVDSQGRGYDRLSDDMLYIADYLEFGKQLQPSLTASGAIVFELPSDSSDLKLSIRGDWTSASEAKITITKIDEIGTDTTQAQKIAEMTGIY